MKALCIVLLFLAIAAPSRAADAVPNSKTAIEIGKKICGKFADDQTAWHAKLVGKYWQVWTEPDNIQTRLAKADGQGVACWITACVDKNNQRTQQCSH